MTDRILRLEPAAALGLGPTEGQPALRRALATRAGAPLDAVLVLTGSQQGLDLIARCLLDPGDSVVMDRPGYLGAIQTFRAAGARIAGWDIERADLTELEDLVLRYRPKLLYTNPTFQNPTGRPLPVATRRELLSLAARYRLPVVEDEPYRDLAFPETPGPPPSLYQLDARGLVIHLSTFSKTLASGLRLGWLVAAPAIVDQLTLIKQRSDVFSPSLVQLVVAELLRGGRYDEHLRSLRAEHARRQETMLVALAEHLPGAALTGASAVGGLYLWRRLGGEMDSALLLEEATAAGVSFVDGAPFFAGDGGARHLRLCFTATPAARIPEGVRRLAAVIAAGRARRPPGEGTRTLV